MGFMLTIFTKGGCAPCATAKKYLDSKNVEYQEKPYYDPQYIELQKTHGFRTVPVITNGTDVVVGLNFGKLSELL